MKFGDYILKYQEEHGKMSDAQFAALVGLSKQYIGNLKRGLNNDGKPASPTMKTVSKVAKGTGIGVTELLRMLDDTVRVNTGEFSMDELSDRQKELLRLVPDLPDALVEEVLEFVKERKEKQKID